MQYAKPKVYWLMLIGVIFSILNTSTSYADVTCPPGMIADNFAQTDYSALAPNTSPPTPASNVNITGTASESYLVASNALTTSGNISGTNLYRLGTDPTTTLTSIPAFEFFQDFTDANSTRTVTYRFTNKFTGQPQTVSNLGLSVFDIDANFLRYDSTTRKYVYEFKDAIKVVGYDVNGAAVTPEVTSRGQNITNNNGSSINYQNVYNTDIICTNSVADSKCQISYTFTTPIISLAITYGNDNVTNNISYLDQTIQGGSGNPGDQAVFIHFDGYCYTPQPRLSLTKVLADNRLANTDQFTVQIKNGTTVVNSTTNSTTTGTTNVVTTGTGTTGTFKVDPTKTYQLTEIAAGTTDLTKYAATYSCKKADGTTVTTLNPNSLNLTYGDNWTCTVTNSQRGYTFSGIVFNDNGGLTLANDLSVPVGTNTTYFNGVYDSSVEKGITQAGLTIDLAKNCNTTTPTIINSAPVGSDGTYSISATSTQMANATNVCLIQREPNGNLTSYPVDTTNNQANITFASTTYDYQNINFGEVTQNNAGLVLVKEQATNDCNITAANLLTLSYGTTTLSNIDARKCVAYKITAYNRTNLAPALTNVQITDPLPKKGVSSSTVTSTLVAPSDTTTSNFNVNLSSGVAGAVTGFGQSGTVVSNVKSISKGVSIPLYFNTKYDSSLP